MKTNFVFLFVVNKAEKNVRFVNEFTGDSNSLGWIVPH